MGYFSNGTEGMDYEEEYCSKCVHMVNKDGTGCAVWNAHMLRNYQECNKEDSILHLLIPRKADSFNDRCLMFWPGESPTPDSEEREQLRNNINPAYREWATKKGII